MAAAAVLGLAPCQAMPPLGARRFPRDAARGCAKAPARARLEEARASAPQGELRGRRRQAAQTLRRLRPRSERAQPAIQLRGDST
eukprot:1929118-Pyramimonas_sp.AAC.1